MMLIDAHNPPVQLATELAEARAEIAELKRKVEQYREMSDQAGVEDLTERRRADARLRESEARLREVVENSAAASYKRNLSTNEYEYVSPAFARMSGYSDGEMSRLPLEQVLALMPAEDRAAVEHAVAEALTAATGTAHHVQYRFKHKDGVYRWLADHFSVLRDTAGRNLALVGSVTDVTDRKLAEVALKESEARFSGVFKTSPNSITVARLRDTRFLDVNDAFTVMSGYTREEALATTSAALGVMVDDEERKRMVATLAAGGSVTNHELSFRRKNGDLFTAMYSARVIQIGGEQCILSTTNDISERKRAEEDRARLEAELHQAQKIDSVGRLAGGVAHDFNNMLAVILANTEAALEEVDARTSLHEDLKEILSAARRSSALTRQLLTFARRQPVSPKVLDLNEAVSGMLKLLERLIGEDVQVAWLPGEGLWPLKVDPSQIDQTLTNLCVNARDAIAGVGKVTIETRNVTLDEGACAGREGALPGDYVRLTVSDTGCGMNAETLAHLFEPFFSTKAAGKGTGLGLATVYGIVKQNHGFIEVHSEPGRGTTFTLYLPRHQALTEQAPANPRVVQATRGHETILLVEDEAAILRVARRILDGLGYTVLVEHAGEGPRAGRGARRRHSPAAERRRHARDERARPRRAPRGAPSDAEAPLHVGHTADVIARNGVLDEGVDFLQKPFSKADLAARVREALDRGLKVRA